MTIGAQLYTLRAYTQTQRDLAETLARVGKMGYDAIQLSAMGPIAPKLVRQMADDNGLKIVLTHMPEARILDDTEKVIEEHQVLGCQYIGLGSMGDRYRSEAWVERFALDFEPAMKKIKDAGMLFMYHNHAFEFEPMGGRRPLVDALEKIPAELMGITLDTYWIQYAGCDVLQWLERWKDRIHCVHFKDMTVVGHEIRMAAVGDGNIDFVPVLNKIKQLGTTKHLLVEQDNCYGDNPFDCMQRSCDHIRSII